jgi:hypothetical protein
LLDNLDPSIGSLFAAYETVKKTKDGKKTLYRELLKMQNCSTFLSHSVLEGNHALGFI